MTKDLSIIVPVYNEENRMQPFLKRLVLYCKKNFRDYELIFVDDGSADDSLKILKLLEKKSKNAKVFSYHKNRGKGAAVKLGVEKAKGRKIVFIDADGSIRPEEIANALLLLKESDVVIGDRYNNRENVNQPRIREFAGNTFNSYVNLLFGLGIKDTLCGIKAFRKEIAAELFKELKSDRWEFDVEILYKIKREKIRLVRMKIPWEYKKGTKMKLSDPVKMAIRLAVLRLRI